VMFPRRLPVSLLMWCAVGSILLTGACRWLETAHGRADTLGELYADERLQTWLIPGLPLACTDVEWMTDVDSNDVWIVMRCPRSLATDLIDAGWAASVQPPPLRALRRDGLWRKRNVCASMASSVGLRGVMKEGGSWAVRRKGRPTIEGYVIQSQGTGSTCYWAATARVD
jgi:hypothetical protein